MMENLALQAKKESGAIYIFWLGKWRPITFHKYGHQLPSEKFINERVIPSFMNNAGLKPEEFKITLDWQSW